MIKDVDISIYKSPYQNLVFFSFFRLKNDNVSKRISFLSTHFLFHRSLLIVFISQESKVLRIIVQTWQNNNFGHTFEENLI